MTNKRKLRIGVLGPHQGTDDDYHIGREVGRLLAESGAILVCGGLDGMMEAAAQGARSAGGTTVGILPGPDASAANDFIDIPIPTDVGPFRNALIVRACDAVIAIRGAYGTLSEIAFALRLGVPVVGIKTWQLVRDGEVDPGIHTADTPEEAVTMALELAQH